MIKIKQNNAPKYRKYVLDGLVENNKQKCKWFKENSDDEKNKNFLVFDEDRLVGGAIGHVLYNWYFLELLWIEEAYRGQDIGTALIKNIEEYANKENLTGIRMETWNFQAKGFYEKMGYKLYATIEDCPPGTIDYFFKKKLNDKE
ncbi:MAG: GNAT family N-acetyltransferase [Bacilli bacterium]|nr:GNAT family N-acetyltransferase [Bacilli bacterium]